MSELLKSLISQRDALKIEIDHIRNNIELERQRIEFDKYGLNAGDIVESKDGSIYKLARFEGCSFFGHKKTKNGWHKTETYIHGAVKKAEL
jgi:hypothetical protein